MIRRAPYIMVVGVVLTSYLGRRVGAGEKDSEWIPTTAAEWREVIVQWLEAPSYQASDPASTVYSLAFSSPDLMKLGLQQWAYQNMIRAERRLQDAEEQQLRDLAYYRDRADRWQAIHTWVTTGDWSRIKEIEKKDPERYRRFRALLRSVPGAGGERVFADDFEEEEPTRTVFNWGTDTKGKPEWKQEPRGEFRNWLVTHGAVDLLVEAGNTYVDLDGTFGWGKTSRDQAVAGTLTTRRPIPLEPGTYRLSFKARGNPFQGSRPEHKGNPNTVKINLGSFRTNLTIPHGDPWQEHVYDDIEVSSPSSATLTFDHSGSTGDWDGIYMDDVEVSRLR